MCRSPDTYCRAQRLPSSSSEASLLARVLAAALPPVGAVGKELAVQLVEACKRLNIARFAQCWVFQMRSSTPSRTEDVP
jgi:hypothetical protein